MPENHKNDHDSQKKDRSIDDEIIELSEIAIGITPEDDAIVELTEGLIDEAFVGFTGATSELIEEDEQRLDLSGTHGDTAGDAGILRKSGDEADDAEKDIIAELDNYFGTEDDAGVFERAKRRETPDIPSDNHQNIHQENIHPASNGAFERSSQALSGDFPDISPGQLDEAIERVIRKMFAEKINRILDEVIERTVTEEISQLRDYLLGMAGEKK